MLFLSFPVMYLSTELDVRKYQQGSFGKVWTTFNTVIRVNSQSPYVSGCDSCRGNVVDQLISWLV